MLRKWSNWTPDSSSSLTKRSAQTDLHRPDGGRHAEAETRLYPEPEFPGRRARDDPPRPVLPGPTKGSISFGRRGHHVKGDGLCSGGQNPTEMKPSGPGCTQLLLILIEIVVYTFISVLTSADHALSNSILRSLCLILLIVLLVQWSLPQSSSMSRGSSHLIWFFSR